MLITWVSIIAPLLSAVIGAAVGSRVAHRTAVIRDLGNEQRARRVEHLVLAYRRLEASANRRKLTSEQKLALEGALSDVILLGNEVEVEAARLFMQEFARKGGADLAPLLRSLRDSLRAELRLPQAPLPDPYIIRLAE